MRLIYRKKKGLAMVPRRGTKPHKKTLQMLIFYAVHRPLFYPIVINVVTFVVTIVGLGCPFLHRHGGP